MKKHTTHTKHTTVPKNLLTASKSTNPENLSSALSPPHDGRGRGVEPENRDCIRDAFRKGFGSSALSFALDAPQGAPRQSPMCDCSKPLRNPPEANRAFRVERHQFPFHPLGKTLRAFLGAAAFALSSEQTFAGTGLSGGNLYDTLKTSGALSGTQEYVLTGDVTWEGSAALSPSAGANITIRGWVGLPGNPSPLIQAFGKDIYGFLFTKTHTLNIYNVRVDGGGLNGSVVKNSFFYVNHGALDSLQLNLEGSIFSNFYADDSTAAAGAPLGGVLTGSNNKLNYTINGGSGNVGAVFEGNHSNPGSKNELSGGGVITMGNNNTLKLDGTLTFRENYSYLSGGAIALVVGSQGYGYTSTFTSSDNSNLLFEGNHARVYGGALSVWGGASVVNFNGETTFKGNFIHDAEGVKTDKAKRGGAINIGPESGGSSSDVKVKVNFKKEAVFENNYVIGSEVGDASNGRHAYGGAISAYEESGAYGYQVTFDAGAIFRGNYVVAPGAGGEGNGGAIFYDASKAKLTLGPGTRFEGNLAQTYGGAIYLKAGTITLNASEKGNIIFQGNKQGVVFEGSGSTYTPTADTAVPNGVPNAVYLGASGTFVVDTQGKDSKVEFYDPIYSGGDVTFEKTGSGSVIFYDYGSLTGMKTGAPTTSVTGGFFVLTSSDSPDTVAKYGTLDKGTVTVSGTPSLLGVIVGKGGAELQANKIEVNGYGEIWADDPDGKFAIKANIFNLGDNGGLGGSGTLRIENSSGVLVGINTTGTFIIDAIDHDKPEDSGAVFTLDSSLLAGDGKLKKTGPGSFVADRGHSYTGGTQVDAGTLLVTFPGETRQTSNSIGTGNITVNEHGTLFVQPTGTGDFEINNTLTGHNSGNTGGLVRVDLGNRENVLTFTNSKDYDGRLLLENLTYTMITTTGDANRQLAKAKVEAGAGSLLHVGTGVSETEGFKFAGGTVRFEDVAGTPQTASRITTATLDVSGSGSVQLGNAALPDSLFTDNNTPSVPLLQRDDYGLARRQLIGAKNGGKITVTGDAKNITLLDSNGNAVNTLEQGVELEQGDEIVATQYLTLSSKGITTGPQNDGLYVGATLSRLDLHAGKTTVLGGDVKNVTGGNDFSAQITGGGNLDIAANESIVLNNADSTNPNTFTGKTTVSTGRLVGGAEDVIAKSISLEVKAKATFDTGDFNQTVNNLSGEGTVEVNTTGDKKLTIAITEEKGAIFSGVLAGSGNIEKTGDGALVLDGKNTHGGNWTISGGDVLVAGLLGATGASGNYAGDIKMKGASSLIFDQTENQILSGNITRENSLDTATVEKRGTGTLTLSKGKIIEPKFTHTEGTLAGEGRLYKVEFTPGAKISPGANDGKEIGKLHFGESSGSTEFSSVYILLNLKGAAESDTIAVTGDVWFGKNNTIDFQWDDKTFKDGSYTMIETEGNLFNADGNSLTSGDILDAKFFQGGAAFTNQNNSAELRIVITSDGVKKIVLTTWANKKAAVYWDGKPGTSDKWNTESENKNWLASAGQNVSFQTGDIAIFNDDAWAKTVKVDAGGVTVYAMTVTTAHGVTYTFEGGDITGDSDSWTQGGTLDAVSRLLVEPNATAIFNNAKVEFPAIEVKGTAVFNTVVNVTDAGNGAFKATGDGYIRLGNEGSFSGHTNILLDGENTILDFNRTDKAYTYDGVISGSGNVRKTGDAEVTLSGKNTYEGGTRVSAGNLKVTGWLGANENGGDYGGKIHLENTVGAAAGSLEFDGKNENDARVQVLGGIISGDSGTEIKVTGGRKLEIASDKDNSPYAAGTKREHNAFHGNITLSGAGELTISGRLNVVVETFDGGTPWGKSYQHSHYAGNMEIGGGSTVNFTYVRDYQLYTGALSGDGNLNIRTGMPFYFNGNGSAFSGNTTIGNNSIFHLNVPATGVGAQYGNGAEKSMFTVQTGSSLYVGGGGKIYTKDFTMEKNTTLVVNPGKFAIDASDSLTFGVKTDNAEHNITLVFRVDNGDLDTDSYSNPKLTVGGGGGDGIVLYPKTTLRVDSFGYIPQPSQDGIFSGHFTLIEGLNLDGMKSDGESDDDALVSKIFGQTELYIMNSKFKVRLVNGNKLVLDQLDYTPYPEPATYGLFSGVMVAGLTFLHRRRKAKGKKI